VSYDYLMFHAPGLRPQWVKRIGMFTSGQMGSLGTPEELMEKISELFPKTRWHKMPRGKDRRVPVLVNGGGIDPNAPTWFGEGGPEFQLSADVDGRVKSMMVSRAERREVRLLCRRLGLAYVDLQADGLFGMLFR